MIDYSHEIFTRISKKVKEIHGNGVQVIGEYVSVPTKFPCVTVDEIYNVASNIDSGEREKYAAVTYRVQIFSNKKAGKRAEAREIFATVSDELYTLNLIRKTYSTTPDVYNAEIYQITATFEGVIDYNGTIYRR